LEFHVAVPGWHVRIERQMETSESGEITRLLQAAGDGDRFAVDALYGCIYEELRRLARRVRRGPSGDTLCTTALVHEAYLKLVPSQRVRWEGRRHFYRVAARAMRQILSDWAARRGALKRPQERWAVTFQDSRHAPTVRPDELLALDEALERLEALDERQARVVEYRFFTGLTLRETAELLDLSVPTVHRDWRTARAWLARELRGAGT
jgi:RNA polymerase sigma factor (TIGR02999 family)